MSETIIDIKNISTITTTKNTTPFNGVISGIDEIISKQVDVTDNMFSLVKSVTTSPMKTYNKLFSLVKNQSEIVNNVLKGVIKTYSNNSPSLYQQSQKNPIDAQPNIKYEFNGNLDTTSILELINNPNIYNPLKIKLFSSSFKTIAKAISNGTAELSKILPSSTKVIEATGILLTNISSLINPQTIETGNSKSIFGIELFNTKSISSTFDEKYINNFRYMMQGITNTISNFFSDLENIKISKIKTVNISELLSSVYKTIDENEIDKKDIKNFKSLFNGISTTFTSFFNEIEKLKIPKAKIKLITSLIEDIYKAITENKVDKKDIKNLKSLFNGISNLFNSFIKYAKSSKLISSGVKVFTNMLESISESLSADNIKKSVNNIKSLTIGLATLGVSLVAFTLLSPIMMIGAFSLKFFSSMIKFAIDKKGVIEMAIFTGALATMGLAIWAFSEIVNPQAIIPVALGLVTLAGALWLFSGKGSKMFGISTGGAPPVKNLLFIATGLATLGLSIWLWDNLNITTDTILKVTMGMVTLATATWAFSKIKDTSITKMIGVTSALGVLGLSLYFWQQFNITNTTLIASGLAVTSLAIAARLYNNINPLGIAAMLGTAGAVVALGYGVSLFKDASAGELLGIGLFVAGLGAATYLFGNPVALLGATTMAVVGVSLITMGIGIKQIMKSEPNTKTSIEFIKSLSIIALGMAALSGPAILAAASGVLLIPALTSAIMASVLLKQINSITYNIDNINDFNQSIKEIVNGYNDYNVFSLAKTNAKALLVLPILATSGIAALAVRAVQSLNIDKNKLSDNASGMKMFIDEMIDVFISTDGKTKTIRKGVRAVARLSNTVKSLADAVYMAANLEYTENEVIDGKITPKSVRKLNSNDFTRVGEGIAKLLNSLISPLIEIGSAKEKYTIGNIVVENPYKSNKVKKGVKALSKIGNIFTPLSELVTSLSSADIFGKDGEKNIDRLNISIGSLISNISLMLQDIASLDIGRTRNIKRAIKNIIPIFEPYTEFLNNVYSLPDKDISIVNQVSDSVKYFLTTVTQFDKKISKSTTKRITSILDYISNIKSTGIKDVNEQLGIFVDKLNDYEKSIASIRENINGVDLAKAVIIKDITTNIIEDEKDDGIKELVNELKNLINVLGTMNNQTQSLTSSSNSTTNYSNNITNNKSINNGTDGSGGNDSVNIEISNLVFSINKLIGRLSSPLTVTQKTGDKWKVQHT